MKTFEDIYRKALKESKYNLGDMEIDEIIVDFIELMLNQRTPIDEAIKIISQNWNIEPENVHSIINEVKDNISLKGLYH